MNPLSLTIKEILHRWKSSLLIALIVAAITGTITYFAVNSKGFEKEVGRNARDIGSNIVVLPADVDQLTYHNSGGFNEETMPSIVVDQLVEFRASLNHLIPMLERKAPVRCGDKEIQARVVGLSASIPVPGRPKAPMQKSIKENTVQIGDVLAERLGIERGDKTAQITVASKTFPISHFNRRNGTWQDSAIFMELKTAQELFALPDQISRIEAIECTQEKCQETGLQSDVVLTNELARITDAAVLLRREQMADARLAIRALSQKNLNMLRNLLWLFLAVSMISLATLNTMQREAEIGVLQSVGYGQTKIAIMFVLRSFVLGLIGSLAGVGIGALISLRHGKQMFEVTGKKFEIDWSIGLTVGLVAIALSMMATLIPAILSATQHPADLIGKDG